MGKVRKETHVVIIQADLKKVLGANPEGLELLARMTLDPKISKLLRELAGYKRAGRRPRRADGQSAS